MPPAAMGGSCDQKQNVRPKVLCYEELLALAPEESFPWRRPALAPHARLPLLSRPREETLCERSRAEDHFRPKEDGGSRAAREAGGGGRAARRRG